MAVNFNPSAQISNEKHGSFPKYAKNKEFMSKRSDVSQKTTPIGPLVLRTTASIKNKVYEDQSKGIICYRDKSGEIICEGYDEGPNYHRISRPIHHPSGFAGFSDAEMMNLLPKQSWLQIVKAEGIDFKVEGVPLLDLSWFNSFG